MSIPVGLPPERYLQLNSLSQKLGLTIADTVGTFIKSAIEDGVLPPDIPGWKIVRENDLVLIASPEEGIDRVFSPAEARSIGAALKEASRPRINRFGLLNLDIDMAVYRVGMAVKITDNRSGSSRTLARSVADDLADLIVKAAA